MDVEKLKGEIEAYKNKAEAAEREYNEKLAARDFDDALRAEIESVKFSSDAAKRAAIADIRGMGLKAVDGKILGLSDVLAQMRQKDPSAFVDEKTAELEQNRAVFTARMPQTGGNGNKYSSREEIMKIKDTSERQAAIRDNIGLFK